AAARPLSEGVRLALAFQPDSADPAGLLGALTVAVPALLRAARGERPVAPDPALGTAADTLRMLHGASASEASSAALDTYLTVMAESGLSASGFTARIVASTRASLAGGAWCLVRVHRPVAWRGAGANAGSAGRGGKAGGSGGMAGSAAAAWRATDGVRPSGVPRQRPARRGNAAGAVAHGAAGRAAGLRHATGTGGRHGDRAGEAGSDAAPERGDHGGAAAGRGGDPAGGVHADIRDRPLRRLAGARDGAAEDRPDDP